MHDGRVDLIPMIGRVRQCRRGHGSFISGPRGSRGSIGRDLLSSSLSRIRMP
ncbi:unnamed protein product, partial [Nesidiocoris tenuis]